MSESKMQDAGCRTSLTQLPSAVVFDLDDDMLQARHEPGLIGN